MRKLIIYILIIASFLACSTTKKEKNEIIGYAMPTQIIYKTKKDYSQNVTIQMNKEKTKITGFPAPSDIQINGELQTPIPLDKGFLYDRRGVSINTVFISMTYQEYSKLKKAPPANELMSIIIDKNPMVELYYCPSLKQNSKIETMNALVNSGFPECKKISNIK